jgi:hypothetical protein
MKRLITITTLSLALSFSSLSFASDYMSLYTKPLAKSEVKSEIRSGNVEKDFMSFYTSPKATSPTTSLTSDRETNDEYLLVFGVWIER